ncbi:MAG: DUF4292 domain-containing protein [Chitinophagales bacterium]|nr:DUF4292 domain-containing protein [Chitinophagales bacterium]MDW8274293.1 DUF4292 domain-containing protein [Chitinophagales bacterium]
MNFCASRLFTFFVYALSFVCIASSFVSCKNKKRSIITSKTEKIISQPDTLALAPDITIQADSSLRKLKSFNLEFDYLSMRCKTSLEEGEQKQEFTANFRMKKDSALWVSITGTMGIEAARIMITKDSFFLINKLSKSYITQPLADASALVPMNISVSGLQQLFVGVPVFLPEAEVRSFQADTFEIIRVQNAAVMQTISVDQKNYTVKEILLADRTQRQDVRINFEKHIPIGEKWLPLYRKIIINRGAQKMQLELETIKYSLNEKLSFPFEIHENYRRD